MKASRSAWQLIASCESRWQANNTYEEVDCTRGSRLYESSSDTTTGVSSSDTEKKCRVSESCDTSRGVESRRKGYNHIDRNLSRPLWGNPRSADGNWNPRSAERCAVGVNHRSGERHRFVSQPLNHRSDHIQPTRVPTSKATIVWIGGLLDH